MKNIKVGKATDGLVGNPKNKKPRYYAVIHVKNGYVALAKVYTTDKNNKRDAEKVEKKLRKLIEQFSPTSGLDKRLYTKKSDGSFIKINELDFESKNNFTFGKKKSISIYKFIFEDKNNTDALIAFIKEVIKKEPK